MRIFYFLLESELYVSYLSEFEIMTVQEMEAFMASSLEFGVGHTRENALEDLHFNLAGIGTIKLHS